MTFSQTFLGKPLCKLTYVLPHSDMTVAWSKIGIFRRKESVDQTVVGNRESTLVDCTIVIKEGRNIRGSRLHVWSLLLHLHLLNFIGS